MKKWLYRKYRQKVLDTKFKILKSLNAKGPEVKTFNSKANRVPADDPVSLGTATATGTM